MSLTRVALAGSTGSIGTQALEVIDAESEHFELAAIGATGRQPEVIIEQARRYRPAVVAISDPDAARFVAAELPGIEVRGGADAMASLALDADVVVNGVVGFAGLPVTLATLAGGKRLALANKESLIAAGPVVKPLRAVPGAHIVPVDSEHCAIHQCLRSSSNQHQEVQRLLLTASGGPFRGRSAESLRTVSIEDALKHPTWSMGPKITIDSSTLMNKGLEVIEAHELFGVAYDKIVVVVHPQSVVHSMVEFTDGAVIAQLSMPDMRLPIAYALDYPQRASIPFGGIDWSTLNRLDFELPDTDTFRCLSLAYQAGQIGGTAPAWLSAANEVAVEAFLAGRVLWSQIPSIIEETLQHHDGAGAHVVDDILEADRAARTAAEKVVAS